jgi:hypothetical protein
MRGGAERARQGPKSIVNPMTLVPPFEHKDFARLAATVPLV